MAGRTHPEFPDYSGGQGSISVGSVATGHLVRGSRLPHAGPNHVILDEHTRRGTNWGTDELVRLLLEGAGAVAAEFAGSKMTVGNIGKGGGGDIPWSISHNSGRDADVAFYLVDEEGNQVVPSTMVNLQAPDGTVLWQGGELRFDPARNWTFAKTLLAHEETRVQYIFCADFLIKKMFEYAKSKGEDPRYLASLNPTLRQPRGTQPHDDHFHIRVYCSREDQADGCRDIVAGREIVPRDNPLFARRVKDLKALLGKDAPLESKAEAVRMLGILRAPRLAHTLYDLLPACLEPLCLEAVNALEANEARPRPSVLLDLIRRTNDVDTVAAAFRLLRAARPKTAGKVLPLLSDERTLSKPKYFFETTLVVREQACYLLGWLGNPAAGKALGGALADEDLHVRAAALWALRAIAAADVFPDTFVSDPADDGAERWRRWWRRHKKRDKNLKRTLLDRGYRVRNLSKDEAFRLLPAILDADFISLNVQRRLNSLFKTKIDLQLKDKKHVHWLWKKHLKRWRRKRRKRGTTSF